MKKHLTLLGIAAMATAVLAGCSNDEVVESYRGEEISFKTRIATRAQEIATTAKLDKFYVWGDAQGYPEFFLNRGVATRRENSSTYDLTTADGNKVYWPSGVEYIDFWAYGPTDIAVTANVTLTDKRLKGFKPEANTTEGGKNHKDLIVAHKLAHHTSTSGANVDLTFYHALSGITLNLQSGDKTKIMRLKGAWFVNAISQGDLFYDADATNPVINWELDNSTATYGVNINGEYVHTSPVCKALDKGTTDLMLIPQQTDKLVFSNGSVQTDGSYILLLCQIISEHNGATHTNESTVADDTNAKHYHLLFPESNSVYTSLESVPAQYAYTCVPVAFDWKGGMRYNYTLTFCGANSGGGIYPPTDLPDGLPEVDGTTIIDRPTGKKPGDPVLDNPITFTVDIDEWKESNNDTNLQ